MFVPLPSEKSPAPLLPRAVAERVDHFRINSDRYMDAAYNESEARAELIDPLLEALGWDVRNKGEAHEKYKPVKREDAVTIAGRHHAPDYSLRFGGARKILVEAKKPATTLKHNAEAAFQLRRYAWSAQIPVGILTNFAEFAVYDCREKPSAKHTAGHGRVCHFSLKEYGERWEWLRGRFSPDAIRRGGFDRFVSELGDRRGTEGVGDAFLRQMEKFRADLAREIALRNPKVGEMELNRATQRILDRVIFLRVCEDRGVEDYGRLRDAAEKADVYAAMMELFHSADRRYNSGLFHFRPERGRPHPDRLTPKLKIRGKALRDIVAELYPPSPYDFSAIGADILGQVYERFLGKEIHLTAKHQARVTEKPEVRKQGGVFYTPEWVVDYIVRQTVGNLLRGKNPGRARKIRVLDPACGSGSFLLGAYQFLLDWHLDEYRKDPAKSIKSGRIVTDERGGHHLSLRERREILLANIWGVDKDAQATEVTKLSLMLKCLEGENAETVRHPRALGMRALPDLGGNIRAGNSIVASDFYGELPLPKDEREIARVNAFDWGEHFPQILRDEEGFDAVIGNPPYVRQEILGEDFKEYAKCRYKAHHGKADLFAYFIERGLSLMKPGGRFSFIVANRWLRADYGGPLRNLLRDKAALEEIADFGELPVFRGAATFPCIVAFRKPPRGRKVSRQRFRFTAIKSLEFKNLADEIRREGRRLDERSLCGDRWSMSGPEECGIFDKMARVGIPLREILCAPIMGIKTGLNDAFVIDAATRRRLIRGNRQSAQLIAPVVRGDDVRGYAPLPDGKWLICIPRGFTNEKRGKSGPRAFMESAHPAVMGHLKGHEKPLKRRDDQGDYWWELRACSYYDKLARAKIILPIISKDRRMTFDPDGICLVNSACFIPSDDLVLLAVLNSRLAQLWMKRHASVLGDADNRGRINWLPQDVERIPIPPVRTGDKEDAKRRREIVALARRMLDIRARAADASEASVRDNMEKSFAQMDRQMDEKIFALYRLNRREAKIVSASA